MHLFIMHNQGQGSGVYFNNELVKCNIRYFSCPHAYVIHTYTHKAVTNVIHTLGLVVICYLFFFFYFGFFSSNCPEWCLPLNTKHLQNSKRNLGSFPFNRRIQNQSHTSLSALENPSIHTV